MAIQKQRSDYFEIFFALIQLFNCLKIYFSSENLYPEIKYRIPGINGKRKLGLRFAFEKNPTKKTIAIGTTMRNPPTFSYFQPKNNPTRTNGNIIRAVFSHNE